MLGANSKSFQFPEVRVVEASAGSGKTYALAKRYVQLLLDPSLPQQPIPFRDILAITFTNKSAFEMKKRILEFLKKIALEQLTSIEQSDLLVEISLNRKQAANKAFKIMDNLIRNYNFFQVQTIDSFVNALLSGCAFKIGLSANFKIKRNSTDYLEFSLDNLIERANGDQKILKIFEQFLQQYLFLENRTSWFPKKDMLYLMESLFYETNRFGVGFRGNDKQLKELIHIKQKILKLLRELQQHLPEGTDGRFNKSLDSFLSKHSNSFDIDSLSDYFARDVLPIKKGNAVPLNIAQLWDKIKANIKKLCEETSFGTFNSYISIFNHVTGDFYRLAGQDDILFLEELNKKARLLFDEDAISVEELYYRLATRFRHYLIDEFQDTSALQWQNFVLMIEEALSSGGSLFYVGDKKQAIYGFRGGEFRLFDHIKEQFQMFNVQVEVLEKNWRSQKAVVEFNNKIFSQDNLKRLIDAKENYEREKKIKNAISFTSEDIADILHIFHDARQSYQSQNVHGYVKVEYVDEDNKEARDLLIKDKLIVSIKELLHRFSARDMAILTRGNKEIELITSWLLEADIFVESERTLNIKENFLIKELISFLQFLNSPIDNLAFASFMLGDIFTTASGLEVESMRKFIFKLRGRFSQENDLCLYKEFRSQFPRVWDDLIDEFFKSVGLFPLYELVVSIMNRFDCICKFSEYQGFFMRFLEIIKKQEEENTDLNSFLEYFKHMPAEDLYVNVTDSDSIKVLTIHKAKGLEFPVVIIPFLGMDIQLGAGGTGHSYIIDAERDHLKLIQLKRKYLNFSDQLKSVYHEEYKKLFLAELNNVYVALTRAKQELYVFIPKRVGKSLNLVKYLIPEENLELGQKIIYPISRQKKSHIMKLPPSEYGDWLDFLKDEFVAIHEIENRELILQGEVFHFILSFIGNLSGQDKEGLIKNAVEETRVHFSHLEDMTTYECKVRQLLDKESLRPFFFVKEGTVYQEKDVINSYGHTRRIDRLIVKKEEVWVIDYKSSQENAKSYYQQVREYISIVSDLYSGKMVKGFLIYLDQLEAEEVT